MKKVLLILVATVEISFYLIVIHDHFKLKNPAGFEIYTAET